MSPREWQAQVAVSHHSKRPILVANDPLSPGIPRISPWWAGEAAPPGKPPQQGTWVLMGRRVVFFLTSQQQLRKNQAEQSAGEQRNESRLVEPELAHSGLQNHTTVRAMLCVGPNVREEFPPFIKFSFSNLIAASNKQFFQISSDLRSSEYVELKKHQDPNYGYYRELFYAHHRSIWLQSHA